MNDEHKEYKCPECGDDDACYLKSLPGGWGATYPKYCVWNGEKCEWMERGEDICGFATYSRDPLKEPS